MAFNGSGTYVRPTGQPVVSGTAISDSVFNTLTSDLATALTTCVTRNGQSPATANLPMGAFKLTGLGNGSSATDSAAYGQIQSSANRIITVGGTADVITGSLTPTLLGYVTGDIFSFVVGSTNTTNVTINIDGLGARALTVSGTTALVAGSLPSGKAVVIEYDGTRFQLLTGNYVGAASGTLPVVNGGTGLATAGTSGYVLTSNGTNWASTQSFVSGMIMLWAGSVASVPSGWFLCDGTNSTPDLRNKFIVGAGSTYAVNAAGGSADSIVPSHTHTITDPGHAHSITTYSTLDPGSRNDTPYWRSTAAGTTGTATTGITINTTGVSPTNANLPPYLALAYIMKS
jgi:hypothetical protein